MYRIGVDTGGTFTDTVIVDATPGGTQRVGVGKSMSTRDDLTRGILASVQAAADDLGITLDDALANAETFAHATTVGINALLTGTGARVGLLTTAGFEATVPIARGNKVVGIDEADRTEAVRWEKPPMLLPRRRIIGVRERIDAHGAVIEALDEAGVRAATRRFADDGVESVAIALLWSIVDARHEQRAAEIVAEELPDAYVTVSHEVALRIGEYERTMTTVLNAYVAPLVQRYVRELGGHLHQRGFRGRFVVTRTSGGVRDAELIARIPVDTLNSGPVGGVSAALDLGKRLGHANVVATDVGGTSFDVGLVAGGRLQYARRPMIGRYPLATPVVELTSIGTGGGSLAWIDPTLGSLRVGPQSAGAEPGPACYGRGGTRPTVTDAAAALGYLTHLGGRLELDVQAARDAIEAHVAGPLGLDVERAADGILRVANAQMADLVRRATVQRGHDPATFALYAYGGAAPQYAGRYAADLGLAHVVIPALASVFSAYGAAATELRSIVEVELRPAPLADAIDLVRSTWHELEARARAELGLAPADERDGAVVEHRVSLRFARQVHALPILVGPVLDADALDRAFRAEYERIVGSGTAFAAAAVEVVAVGVDVRAPVVEFGAIDRATVATADGSSRPASRRTAWFDGAHADCAVHDGTTLPAGSRIHGPAFVELPTTTLLVYPGQVAEQLATGDVLLHLPAAPGGSPR